MDKKVYQLFKFSNNKTLFFKIITQFASVKYFFLVCLGLLCFLENKKIALVISALMIIDAFIVWFTKHLIRRERPNQKRLVFEKGYSYPSGHTFSATCFYGFWVFLVWNSSISIFATILLSLVLVLFIFIIGISRIYLGVHYFSDVVGAFLLSSSYLFLFVYFVYDVLKFL